jgi:hypothetical protein
MTDCRRALPKVPDLALGLSLKSRLTSPNSPTGLKANTTGFS